MIILLDLNFTLVSNSDQKLSPFTAQIDAEQYDAGLIEKIKEHTVILITARPEKHRDQTLKSIEEKTGWSPYASFFNHLNLPPPAIKERILLDKIFPIYPQAEFKFLGIESNPMTRSMYNRYGIQSFTKSQYLREE